MTPNPYKYHSLMAFISLLAYISSPLQTAFLICLAMKRTREDEGGMMMIKGLDLTKCLMLISCGLETKIVKKGSSQNGAFECKTCNRQFPSFQALGGHRASHKKPRTTASMGGDGDHHHQDSNKTETKLGSLSVVMGKPKKHECSICGLEFGMGQALGGHMRRHRDTSMGLGFSSGAPPPPPAAAVSKIPVLRRSMSSKRVVCLDLNLTPLENDLKILFGKMAPKVDPFFS